MNQKKTSIFTLRNLLVLHSDYLNELQKKTPETRGTYERTLREFMRWLHLEKSFHFTSEDIERYKRHLFRQKKLTHTSVVMYLTSVRKFCEYLMRRGVLKENPARAVPGGTPPVQHTRKSISIGDVFNFLQTIDRTNEIGFRDFAMAKLMINCGLSEIELVRANVEDVILQKKGLRLRVQGKGKKSKDTVLLVVDEACEAMKSYLSYRTKSKPSDPLFMSAGNRTRGDRMTSRGIRERINFYLTKAGIKNGEARKITALSLRQTAIQMMAHQGASFADIQERFRITKPTTLKLYLNEST
ncbi:MAG: tyrosine-type recombinase/integrase [Bacteroidota bacterium]|nr:tyrosine-type recombinase/integrase [Bacteroidota bacterium]